MTTKIIQHTWSTNDRLPGGSELWKYINDPVDLTFADPPYNYEDDPSHDDCSTAEYRYWCGHVIRKLASMTKKGGMLFWLCPAEDGDWVWQELIRYGQLLQRKPIIWYERFSQYQTKQLTSDYRLLFPVAINNSYPSTLFPTNSIYTSTFNPDDIREESVRQRMGDKRGRVPGHVWTVPRLQGNAKARVKWHPAQLPPAPLARIVKGWANKGDTILDAFAGSGSMGMVCKELGRNFVGVEQSAVYCDKMRHRICGGDNVN